MKQPDTNQMKAAVIIFCLMVCLILTCNLAKGQAADTSLHSRINALELSMKFQADNLKDFEKQFKIGKNLLIYGAILTAAGWSDTNSKENRSKKIGMLLTGLALDIAGSIVLFDSHRHMFKGKRVQLGSRSGPY